MRKELLLVSGLLIGSMAFAIDPAEIDSLINLKGVVVSANKIHVNRNSVPLSISVIEREEIEASSESALLPVLSERVPGLFVTEKGITGFGVSEGAAGTVNIRGVGQGLDVVRRTASMGRYIRPFASGYLCGFGRGKGGGDPWSGCLIIRFERYGRCREYHYPPA
jgi:outer membrane receptor protein involved in Fe transport